MVDPLCQATAGSTTLESFTGVIGRAGLGQGRGVLSRVNQLYANTKDYRIST